MENKEISFTYEGAKYTLAFNRKTVQTMSQAGFDPESVTKTPAIGIPALFKGAFMVHHRNIRSDLVEKIFDSIVNRQELMVKLLEMFYEPIKELMDDPEEVEEAKKVTWETNF